MPRFRPSTPHGWTARLHAAFNGFTELWARHQKWWWLGTFLVITGWMSYDVGQMVARADVLAGTQDIKGVLNIQGVRAKSSTTHGGRLIIMSTDAARYVDPTGAAWNIPDFGQTASQGDLDALEKNNVAMDGSFQVTVHPVKTRPSDLLLATASDLLVKMAFVGVYGLVAFMMLRSTRPKGRFTRATTDLNLPKIADVAGYDGVKDELLEVVDYLRRPERFAAVGARPPRGILLYGPPGNGKTLLAKAVAGEAAATFLEQSASSFMETYVGEGARAVRRLFEEARKNTPAVIFIDEIDTIGGHRSASSHDERVQTLNAILTEMDGFASGRDGLGIVVVAATNRLEVLDEALVRPGRFDRKVWIGPPNQADRGSILAVTAAQRPVAPEVNWEDWARRTRGLSGADLAALVNEAAIEAARAGRPRITNADVAAARDRVWVGAVRKGHSLSDEERRTVAVHELGHAWMIRHVGRAVEQVSIAPRGQALGLTVQFQDEERLLAHKEDIVGDLRVLMGGRAAEQVVLGRISGGAADDMARASDLARAAVLGLGTKRWGAYTPTPRADGPREDIEQEASEWVNAAFADAVEALSPHAAQLRAAAERLVERDALSSDELTALWGPPAPNAPHERTPSR